MEVAVGDSGPPQTRHIVDLRRTTCAQILPLIAFCHHDHGLKILGGRLGTVILPRSLRPFLNLAENVIVQEKREGWVGLVPCGWVAAPEKFWRNAVKMHNSLSHQRLLQCNHFVFMQPHS